MSFQTPLSVAQFISGINQKYFLPGIQREFVWNKDQIVNLFDSILQGYPIGSFLISRTNKDSIEKFTFYKFISSFKEKSLNHNEQVSLNGKEEIESILDGQQRLTALYIGLRGHFLKKRHGKDEYIKQELYINLSKLNERNEDTDNMYILEFRENNLDKDVTNHWLKVGDILDFKELDDIVQYKEKYALNETKILSRLHSGVTRPTINYYLEQAADLHTLLNIFVRVNNGGKKLEYADMLFSIIVAQSSKDDKFREKINQFVDDIKNHHSFAVSKDFFLKSCLFLLDETIKFDVKNFTKSVVERIVSNFDSIAQVLKTAFTLLTKLGFNNKNLPSHYFATVIAYYLHQKNIKSLDGKDYIEERKKIKDFIIKASLKGIFGGSGDGKLSQIRNSMHKNDYQIDVKHIEPKVSFSVEEIEDLMGAEYQFDAYLVLSLLYPNLDTAKNTFHIDHIYPRTKIDRKKHTSPDYIFNLQLLIGLENQEKSNIMPNDWIKQVCKTKDEEIKYREENYIPLDFELSAENYESFVEVREKLMIEKLKSLLSGTSNL